ncbi:MAG: LysM peptidoglycan-binding domain-containing protein [Candidatus Omnitrophica bacterium]|nr:LysM peptidoglycan-binding domain-containing protein [Candidatus Omnitrophota bacterium]
MRYFALPLFLGCVLAVSGCVQTRAYLAERERVDQEVQGVPAPAKPKTRQVVVVEFIDKNSTGPAVQKAVAEPDVSRKENGQSQVVTTAKDTTVVHESNFSFPAKGPGVLTQGAPVQEPALVVPALYKVEKDDTLQKISKKLYGSFSKWTKIYDANKELIKDPNFLKPGITLKIPSAE